MIRWLAVLVLTGFASAAQADVLGSLRETLRALPGKAAISASGERRTDLEVTDKPREQTALRFSVSAGPAGLQLNFPPDTMARADADRRSLEMDQPRPAARALATLDAGDLSAMLNVAPDLLRDLEGATLRSDTAVRFEDAPARLLELALVVRLPAADAKRVNDAQGLLRLWLDAEGLPISAERSVRLKGRVMLIGFEMNDSLSRRLVRRGDRLVALREERRQQGSGFGAQSRDERFTTLQLP